MQCQQKDNCFQINEYIIYKDKQIGKGNFGIVYECKRENQQFNQELLCAKIWILEKGELQHEKLAQRESDILNVLKGKENQNLVKIYYSDYNKELKRLIIIMERCHSDLKVEMKGKQFSQLEISEILKQILNGYQTLWENSIVHRDLKPENILIKKVGDKLIYKISDFGTGKICQKNETEQSQLGTPVYQPPECNYQIKDQSLYDSLDSLKDSKQIKNWRSSADVYSLAMMSYHLLFGKLPFEIQGPQSITEFQIRLKTQPIQFPLNFQVTTKFNVLDFIKKSIIFLPDQRITFDIIFSQFLQKEFQTPQKIFPKFNSTNNASNQQTQDQKTINKSPQSFIQQTPVKFPFESLNINPAISQHSQDPRVQTIILKPSSSNQPTPIKIPPECQDPKSQIFDQKSPKSFIQPTPAKFPSESINVNTYKDFTTYLQQEINQNQALFGKQTLMWLNSLIAYYQQCQVQYFQSQKSYLFEVFQYHPNQQYSIDYLKFYFVLLYTLKNNTIQNQQIQFSNKEQLIQQIVELTRQQ